VPITVEDLASAEDPVPQGVPEAPHNPDPPRYLGQVPVRSAARVNLVVAEADVTWRAL
jgi:hypothetical protein